MYYVMVRLSLFFGEQALHEVENGRVTATTLLGEQGRDRTVALVIKSSMTTNIFIFGSKNDEYGRPFQTVSWVP